MRKYRFIVKVDFSDDVNPVDYEQKLMAVIDQALSGTADNSKVSRVFVYSENDTQIKSSELKREAPKEVKR